MTDKESDQNLERFKIAWETRKFEIEMFWRRTNYFLLLNTSVAIGAGTVAIEGGYGPFIFACIIGICVCYAWRRVVWGAKFWQNYWEQVVNDTQESARFYKCPRLACMNKCTAGDNPCEAHDFFSAVEDAPHIEARVRKSLGMRSDSTNTEELSGSIYTEAKKPRWICLICNNIFLFVPLFVIMFVIIFVILPWLFIDNFRFSLITLFAIVFTRSMYRINLHSRGDYKKNVLRKPSVSRSMHAVADFFLFAWFVAYTYALICFWTSKIPHYYEFYCLACLTKSP